MELYKTFFNKLISNFEINPTNFFYNYFQNLNDCDKEFSPKSTKFLKKKKNELKNFFENNIPKLKKIIDEDFNVEKLQSILSDFYLKSQTEIKEDLKLPNISKLNSVEPIHSAFIMPIYVGNEYIDSKTNPYLDTLSFDHPYPLNGNETGIVPEKELLFLDALKNFDNVLNSRYEKLPENFKYPIFIIVGTVSKGISKKASDWLKKTIDTFITPKNIAINYIDNEIFEKFFNDFIFPEFGKLEADLQNYIQRIYDKGLCSYPNIRNFSEIFVSLYLLNKYPNELCATIEVDEDQLIEPGYCEILKKQGTSFLTLGLTGLGSILENGKIISIQAGEYYKYNPDLGIEEAINISDVGNGDYRKIDKDVFYQKNHLYYKSIEFIYNINDFCFRHPSVRGGLIFSLANSVLHGNGFCFDWITRGEDTARLITMFGESNEEIRFIPMLKMAHNQSPFLKKLMKASGNDVASVFKTFVSDLKRWKLKSELCDYYSKKNANIQKNFSPYPGGMFDNIDFRITMTIVLYLMNMKDKTKQFELMEGWLDVYKYFENSNIKVNYPIFLKTMKNICNFFSEAITHHQNLIERIFDDK